MRKNWNGALLAGLVLYMAIILAEASSKYDGGDIYDGKDDINVCPKCFSTRLRSTRSGRTVGRVFVRNDDDFLWVTFRGEERWKLNRIALHIGSHFCEIPRIRFHDNHYGGGDIYDGNYDGGNIYDGKYDGGNIYDGNYDGGNIYDGKYDGGNIYDGNYDGGNIYDGKYDGGNIYDGNYDGGNIYDGKYDGGNIYDGKYDGGNIYDGLYDGGDIYDGKFDGNIFDNKHKDIIIKNNFVPDLRDFRWKARLDNVRSFTIKIKLDSIRGLHCGRNIVVAAFAEVVRTRDGYIVERAHAWGAGVKFSHKTAASYFTYFVCCRKRGGDIYDGDDIYDGGYDGGDVYDGRYDENIYDDLYDGRYDGGDIYDGRYDGGNVYDGRYDGGDVYDGRYDGGDVYDGGNVYAGGGVSSY
ncbi:Glycine-rich cell wall structural protein 1.8-like [Balamuthia mandrillaris]